MPKIDSLGIVCKISTCEYHDISLGNGLKPSGMNPILTQI